MSNFNLSKGRNFDNKMYRLSEGYNLDQATKTHKKLNPAGRKVPRGQLVEEMLEK